jgi:hypothetical protein
MNTQPKLRKKSFTMVEELYVSSRQTQKILAEILAIFCEQHLHLQRRKSGGFLNLRNHLKSAGRDVVESAAAEASCRAEAAAWLNYF